MLSNEKTLKYAADNGFIVKDIYQDEATVTWPTNNHGLQNSRRMLIGNIVAAVDTWING